MNQVIKSPPKVIETLSERCITHIKNRTGITLDFQSETLSLLDFFIHQVLKEEGDGTIPPIGDHRRSEMMHLFAPTLGAYFGEMMRHEFPCRWRLDSDDPKEWLIEFEHVPLRFRPVGAAAEALVQDETNAWGCNLATTRDETEALRERLAAAPPVAESEFFTLSTRFEVIQIAVDYLRARISKQIGAPQNVSSEDYDTLF